MLDESLGDHSRHELIGVMLALATVEEQRERERGGEVFAGAESKSGQEARSAR
jgi:hypothetical protein